MEPCTVRHTGEGAAERAAERAEDGRLVVRYGRPARILLPLAVLALSGVVILADLSGGDRAMGVFYPILVVPAVALAVRESLLRVVVDEGGIVFPPFGHFWRWRPVKVPWEQIAEVQVPDAPGRPIPVLRLVDDTRVWVWLPRLWRRKRKREIAAQMARMRPGGERAQPPASLAVRGSGRLGSRVAGGAMAVVLAHVFLLPEILVKPRNPPPDISACSVLPTDMVRRIYPMGAKRSEVGFTCSWESAAENEAAPSLDIWLTPYGGLGVMKRYEERRRKDTVEHLVRPLSSVGDAAYSWVSIPRRGMYNTEVVSRVGGYLLQVSLAYFEADSPADAQTQAIEVAQAAARRIAERA